MHTEADRRRPSRMFSGMPLGPSKPLEQCTRRELYEQAGALRIRGRSRMNKKELVHAIRRVGGSNETR